MARDSLSVGGGRRRGRPARTPCPGKRQAAGHADMAGHLLTASVLSAPAALLISKIMLPETEQSQTASEAPADVATSVS